MITPGDIEVSDDRDQAECCRALWSAVLRQAIVLDRDEEFLDGEGFQEICRIMDLRPEWTAEKLREAAAGGSARKRLPQHRKHTDETRAKIGAAVARFRQQGTVEHEAWRAKISAAQASRYARLRGEAAA